MDDKILDLIFDPESSAPLISNEPSSNPFQPVAPEMIPTAASFKLDEETYQRIKQMEVEGVQLAEKNDYEASLKKFNEVMEICKIYASVYNNRAQLYRLMKMPDQALTDLDLAIKYSDGVDTKTLRQAYSQRGSVYLLKEDEEKARLDFEVAAQLGSEFAKKEAVRLNPYAKLCSNMVTQLMKPYQEQNCQ